MVTIGDLIDWIDQFAPFRLAAKWDHCGLQVGDPSAEASRVLVALDVTSRTLDEAIRLECRCLVTHHPLIFRPIVAVREDEYPGALVAKAVRARLNLIAAHTNLDIARDGTNDRLSAMLGLTDTAPLEVEPSLGTPEGPMGLGRVGNLPNGLPLAAFARELERLLSGSKARIVGSPEQLIRRVALCTGSGGSLLESALTAGVDAYVTGDLRYHEGQRAVEENLALVDVGHFSSERIIVQPLAERLRSRARELGVMLEVFEATEEEDPFWYV